MLSEKELGEIKRQLDSSDNPLFMFDDDCDGLASFLLLKKYAKKGNWYAVRGSAKVEEKYANVIDKYSPDKIFILDKPLLSSAFISKVRKKSKIIWIDHHMPQHKKGIVYFNPRIRDIKDGKPTSYICYKVVNEGLWVGLVGCIGDFYIPDFFCGGLKLYGDILKDSDSPGKVLFDTEFGKLCKVFSFSLKGKTKFVKENIKCLVKINEPYEILNQTTEYGEKLFSYYEKINKKYEKLLNEAEASNEKARGNLFFFSYKLHSASDISFTGELATQLSYRTSRKVVFIARIKENEVVCSIRSRNGIILPPIIEKCLVGMYGSYGGGHEQAAGAHIKKRDFDLFIEKFRNEIEGKDK